MKTKTIVILILSLSGVLFIGVIATCAGFFFVTFKNLNTSLSPTIDELFAAIDNDTFADTTTLTPRGSSSFAFKPSLSSKDHQVRILVDGDDWLGSASLGIDPPEFFAQPALTTGGELLVGRCECGCVGCDDVTVEMVRQRDEVGGQVQPHPI